jgi:hypothetical protein
MYQPKTKLYYQRKAQKVALFLAGFVVFCYTLRLATIALLLLTGEL